MCGAGGGVKDGDAQAGVFVCCGGNAQAGMPAPLSQLKFIKSVSSGIN